MKSFAIAAMAVLSISASLGLASFEDIRCDLSGPKEDGSYAIHAPLKGTLVGKSERIRFNYSDSQVIIDLVTSSDMARNLLSVQSQKQKDTDNLLTQFFGKMKDVANPGFEFF
ncbi:MAG: hypothetical protein IPK04_18890 [Bdellovibrionales bacterium]|nr:hypothetical protein [Bdellovibrionales bacterium]